MPTDIDGFRDWIVSAWSPNLTVGEWWRKLAAAGYSAPMLPTEVGGLGWDRNQAQHANVVLAYLGVLGPPLGVGLTLVAPTLTAFADERQKRDLIPGILDGTEAWCQLYSEPGAGSDLAGLQTTASRTGSQWVVSGVKTWTSGADLADWGLLLARTDPDKPKHAGISAFALPMKQPGISVSPLRQMTGAAGFSTVMLTEAEVDEGLMIGARGQGWIVAKAMLAEERASYRAAGSGQLVTARPGSIANDLGRRAGSITEAIAKRFSNVLSIADVDRLIALAQTRGRRGDAVVRQRAAQLYTIVTLSRMNEIRGNFDGAANISKLLISETFRLARECACLIVGADATLSGNDSPSGGWAQELTVFSPGPAIYGGTDQIQRNLLGERVLGLPRE